MAAADNNVRPKRQRSAVTARRARRSGLARLLLRLLELLQLDRKLLVLLAASLMPACIIPIGPDWQDPPGEKNQAPRIVAWDPRVGTEFLRNGMATFSITVVDADGDPLFVRWFAGYGETPFVRPLAAEMPKLPRTDRGDLPRPPIEETFDCFDFMYLPSHLSIQAVVADRDFVSSPTDPTTVEEGGLKDFAFWTLNFPPCQLPSP